MSNCKTLPNFKTLDAGYPMPVEPVIKENWMNGPSLANFRGCGGPGWFMGKPPCTRCPTEPWSRFCNTCGLNTSSPYAGGYPARVAQL